MIFAAAALAAWAVSALPASARASLSLSAHVTSSVSLVTPAQARAAIATLWTAREHALDTRDLAAFNRLETGSARLTDSEAAKRVDCGCNKFYWTKGPRTFRSATIFLPRQSAYPIYFAAEVLALRPGQATPAGPAGTAMLLVTKQAANQHWRIAVEIYDAGYSSPMPAFPRPQLDAQGYDIPSSVAPQPPTQEWFPKLADYFNQIKQTGQQPVDSGFAPGPLTSGNGLEARPNGFTSGGLTGTYKFKSSAFGGPWLFNSGGLPTMCGDVVEWVVTTPASPDQMLVQPATRRDWGPDVAPGYYRSLTTLWEWSVCIYPDGSNLAVGGNLGGGYPVRTTGHRIAPL